MYVEVCMSARTMQTGYLCVLKSEVRCAVVYRWGCVRLSPVLRPLWMYTNVGCCALQSPSIMYVSCVWELEYALVRYASERWVYGGYDEGIMWINDFCCNELWNEGVMYFVLNFIAKATPRFVGCLYIVCVYFYFVCVVESVTVYENDVWVAFSVCDAELVAVHCWTLCWMIVRCCIIERGGFMVYRVACLWNNKRLHYYILNGGVS